MVLRRSRIEIVAQHWRSVVMSAPVQNFVDAFGATAGIYALADKRRFRHRSGALHAPPELAPTCAGRSASISGRVRMPSVRCTATPRRCAPATSSRGIACQTLMDRANGRRAADARRVNLDDFSKCMRAQGIAAKTPAVKRVDNAELTHEIETAKDLESAIDTQVIGAVAPGAQIVVYATPDDERGVLDGIRCALFDEEHSLPVLSISFGYAEQLWTPVALKVLDELFTVAALLGVTIFCASGDHGAQVDAAGQPHCWHRHPARSRTPAGGRFFPVPATRSRVVGRIAAADIVRRFPLRRGRRRGCRDAEFPTSPRK